MVLAIFVTCNVVQIRKYAVFIVSKCLFEVKFKFKHEIILVYTSLKCNSSPVPAGMSPMGTFGIILQIE